MQTKKHFRKSLLQGVYLKMLLLLIISVTVLGGITNFWLTHEDESLIASVQSADQMADEQSLDSAFQAAVQAMQSADHEAALLLWHPLLVSHPHIQEIKVNMGFSLYYLGRIEAARDFFLEALEQNAFQANAYYGLAMCHEKMGDLEMALGAMRSYIHLADEEENPQFIRKAQSALWEWQEALKMQRPTAVSDPAGDGS